MPEKRKKNEALSQEIICAEWYIENMTPIEITVKKYLLQLGFQPNLKGYKLLFFILSYALDGKRLLPLKFFGYKATSDKFGVDVASVEKDIQNAISAAWLKGDMDVLYGEFGETLDENKGKPTNKQFILTALDRLRLSI